MPRKVFTTGQIATICSVAPRTVTKWFDSGRLKGYRIPGSQDRRIPFDKFIKFLSENQMPTIHELIGIKLGVENVTDDELIEFMIDNRLPVGDLDVPIDGRLNEVLAAKVLRPAA